MQKTYVKDLIQSALNDLGLSKKELVLRAGYANHNKGLRRLDSFMNGEHIDDGFIEKVAIASGISIDSLHKAIQKDQFDRQQRLDAQARKNFKPYIYLLTKEDRPSQITIFALTGGIQAHKMFYLPNEIPGKSWDEQKKVIRVLTDAHFRLRDGIVPFFGKITGFLYCPTYDSSYEFTLTGETDSVDRGHFSLPQATFRVG